MAHLKTLCVFTLFALGAAIAEETVTAKSDTEDYNLVKCPECTEIHCEEFTDDNFDEDTIKFQEDEMSTTETIDEQDTSTSMSTSTSTSISISTSTSTTAKAEDKRKRREAIPAGEVEEYEDLASGLGVLENSLSEPKFCRPCFCHNEFSANIIRPGFDDQCLYTDYDNAGDLHGGGKNRKKREANADTNAVEEMIGIEEELEEIHEKRAETDQKTPSIRMQDCKGLSDFALGFSNGSGTVKMISRVAFEALDFYEIHWSVNEDDLVIHISKVRAESVPTALRIHIKRPKNKKQIYYVYDIKEDAKKFPKFLISATKILTAQDESQYQVTIGNKKFLSPIAKQTESSDTLTVKKHCKRHSEPSGEKETTSVPENSETTTKKQTEKSRTKREATVDPKIVNEMRDLEDEHNDLTAENVTSPCDEPFFGPVFAKMIYSERVIQISPYGRRCLTECKKHHELNTHTCKTFPWYNDGSNARLEWDVCTPKTCNGTDSNGETSCESYTAQGFMCASSCTEDDSGYVVNGVQPYSCEVDKAKPSILKEPLKSLCGDEVDDEGDCNSDYKPRDFCVPDLWSQAAYWYTIMGSNDDKSKTK